MNVYLEAVFLALLVGAGGTVIGALVAIWIKTTRKWLSCVLLGLASGLMLSIVALDMLPESWEEGGAAPFAVGLALGIGVLWLVSKRFHHEDVHDVDSQEAERIAHDNLVQTGLLLAAGVSIHNLPQGIAIGSGLQAGFAAALSVLLLLHNIPEGMAMAIPLKVGKVSGPRILYVALLTAVPTIVGAIVGVAVSEISTVFISASLSFAGGAMLYLTIHELIPQAAALGKRKYLLLATIIGFLTGGAVVWGLH